MQVPGSPGSTQAGAGGGIVPGLQIGGEGINRAILDSSNALEFGCIQNIFRSVVRIFGNPDDVGIPANNLFRTDICESTLHINTGNSIDSAGSFHDVTLDHGAGSHGVHIGAAQEHNRGLFGNGSSSLSELADNTVKVSNDLSSTVFLAGNLAHQSQSVADGVIAFLGGQNDDGGNVHSVELFHHVSKTLGQNGQVSTGSQNGFIVNIFTLTDEEGNESEFELIASQEIDGVTYVALVPYVEENKDAEEQEYVVLKLEADENGEDLLVTIDDDDEFEKVAEIFEDMLFDEIDYDAE